MVHKQSDRVTPYNDGSSKKAQVEAMFDSVANRYDILNRALSMGIDVGWRKKLIRQMKSYGPKRILDMATGTADLAIMAAKRIPDATVVGIDLSKNMIQLGKKKVAKTGLDPRVRLEIGDSEDIKYDEGQFDAAMVAFGIRNFENLDKGLSELNRVLDEGAPLFILEFSKPTIFPVKQVFNTYFKWIVPLIGRIFSDDKVAYQYLYESVQEFPDYQDMCEKLSEAGFKNCTWEALTFGICCLYKAEKR